MTDREQLIEPLLSGEKTVQCVHSPEVNCDGMKCAFCERVEIADRLIANGVTVQELGGCEYYKENSDGYRKMFGAFSITNPFHGSEWFIKTGHCKPRQICFCPMCGRRLPQPPKGE